MPIVVSFVSQKGGVGKSTLARALLAVAAYKMKARLVDLDPRQASVIAWEKARQRNPQAPVCEVLAFRSLQEALPTSGDIELLIVDTPAGTNRATVEIALHSHLVVQPTGPSADDLVPAVLTFHELIKEGIPKERLVAAACRVLSDGEEATVRAYMQEAGYEVLAGGVPEKIAYREAQNRGHAITETKSARLNAQADALMEALLDKVAKEIKRAQTARGKRPEHKR